MKKPLREELHPCPLKRLEALVHADLQSAEKDLLEVEPWDAGGHDWNEGYVQGLRSALDRIEEVLYGIGG